MSVTQKEIAERLNISQAHVARALSARGRVSESTRMRIMETALEMGYNPDNNTEARNLVARRYGKPAKKGVIAVVFTSHSPANTAAPSLRQVPFFVPVFDGMEDEAAALGLDICLCPMRGTELPRLISERNVDGMIMMRKLPTLIDLDTLDMPMVSFHWQCDYAHSIQPDDYDGAKQETRHLLELGHRRIGFLGMRYIPGFPWERRLNGYLDAMREFGAPVQESWIETNPEWPLLARDGRCAGCGLCAACIGWATLMAKNGGINKKQELPFTALVCYNDIVAMAAIEQAAKDGIRVPQDLSVVGFDDVSGQYNFHPTLTSLDIPRYDMGRHAINLLHEIVHDPDQEPRSKELQHRVLPTTLMVRESTAPPQRL